MQPGRPSPQSIADLYDDGGRRWCGSTEGKLWEFPVTGLQPGLTARLVPRVQPQDPQEDVCRETPSWDEGKEEQHHRDQRQRGRAAGVPPTTERGEASRAGDGETGKSGAPVTAGFYFTFQTQKQIYLRGHRVCSHVVFVFSKDGKGSSTTTVSMSVLEWGCNQSLFSSSMNLFRIFQVFVLFVY